MGKINLRYNFSYSAKASSTARCVSFPWFLSRKTPNFRHVTGMLTFDWILGTCKQNPSGVSDDVGIFGICNEVIGNLVMLGYTDDMRNCTQCIYPHCVEKLQFTPALPFCALISDSRWLTNSSLIRPQGPL